MSFVNFISSIFLLLATAMPMTIVTSYNFLNSLLFIHLQSFNRNVFCPFCRNLAKIRHFNSTLVQSKCCVNLSNKMWKSKMNERKTTSRTVRCMMKKIKVHIWYRFRGNNYKAISKQKEWIDSPFSIL